MKIARDLLEHKGSSVWAVAPNQTVYEAIELMAQHEVGALMVMEGGKLVGVLSERDYARKVILKGRSSRDTLVGDIMTSRVVYTEPSETVEGCMALMTEKRIRHLPVMRGDELVGVLSIGDLVRAIIAEQQYTIEQLERYISG
jgi:CBS domain-containing protein